MGFFEFCRDVAPQLVLACTLVMLLRRKLLKVYPFFFPLK
jgi:hypothetical protein